MQITYPIYLSWYLYLHIYIYTYVHQRANKLSYLIRDFLYPNQRNSQILFWNVCYKCINVPIFISFIKYNNNGNNNVVIVTYLFPISSSLLFIYLYIQAYFHVYVCVCVNVSRIGMDTQKCIDNIISLWKLLYIL